MYAIFVFTYVHCINLYSNLIETILYRRFYMCGIMVTFYIFYFYVNGLDNLFNVRM